METIEVAENESAKPVTESTKTPEKKSLRFKVLAAIITLVIITIIIFATFILTRQRTISTGNARVTTDLIYIIATAPGELERFNISPGKRVQAGQVIGWLHRGESFRSPVDGIIVSTHAVEGQQVNPIEPLAVIADINNLHIQANFYESDIQDIKLGQPVTVTLDGVRGRTLSGYVQHIGRITELELVGGPIVVQTGTFRRITMTIPVKITITDDIDLSLFIGTNARVSIPVLPE